MDNEKIYDCAIIGGGLTGLCLAIQLAQKNHKVILFEQNEYPFHKVCGEYISNESWNFIESLGLNLSELNLPIINQLGVSSTKGYMLEAPLALGGFGISRHTLDYKLAELAKKNKVTILERCKVTGFEIIDTVYHVTTNTNTYKSKLLCGSYGKLNPVFMPKQNTLKKENYVGIKYHVKSKLDSNRIELHNFKGGYCGISKVDKDTYCLCYLTSSQNLKDNNNDIKQLEENVLKENLFLKKYFEESEFLFAQPLVISNITFNKKNTYSNEVFMLGDAAGAIAPLCGNGMSMGMRASELLANHISNFLANKITKAELIHNYKQEWDSNFSLRIKVGYYLQKLLLTNTLTHLSLKLLSNTPKLLQKIISLTHGKPF